MESWWVLVKKRYVPIAILTVCTVLSFVLIRTTNAQREFINVSNNCYSYGGFHIASEDEWIYYGSGNSDEALLRCNTQSGEIEVLAEESASQLHFYQGQLYYYNGSGIVAWDTELESAETFYPVDNELLSYFPYHGKLYCTDFEKSYTVDIASGTHENLEIHLLLYQCAVSDDTLYLLSTRGTDRYLAKFHEDTGDMEIIDSGLLNQLTNTNNRLYYVRNQIVDGKECFDSWYCYENGEILPVADYPGYAIGATREALILEDLETEGDAWLWNGEKLTQIEIPPERQKEYNKTFYMATEQYLASVHVEVDSRQINIAEIYGIPLEPLA